MAYTSIHAPASASLLRILAKPFVAAGQALTTLAESNRRVQEADRLHAMTDAELAALGLTREDIALYVFRDSFYL
ncbi:hypothetical protein [Shimia sp. SDUM112013]|uniref:hypothetical protein n=1 Tax=Shimia sp. SDUM112013 TaxID=3136160 RepID=UPI0032EC0AC6